MAGILKVDQVQSDSNLAFAIAGSNVAFMNATSLQMTSSNISLGGTNVFTSGKLVTAAQPTGAVLQVVQANTIAAISTSSTSFVTTNFSVSITPSSVSSKVLLFVNGGGAYNNAANRSQYGTIFRGATNLGDATYGLERFFSGTDALSPHSMSVLDSPATTSSTTYTCYHRSGSAAEVQFSGTDRALITFTAMEIAG